MNRIILAALVALPLAACGSLPGDRGGLNVNIGGAAPWQEYYAPRRPYYRPPPPWAYRHHRDRWGYGRGW